MSQAEQLKKYTLGRGELYFDKFLTNTTTKTGEIYFGNSTEFNLSQESDKLDHFDSDQGLRVKDDSVTLELRRTGSMVVDNISDANLQLWFLGALSTVSQASATAQTYNLNDIVKGAWYQVGQTASNPDGLRSLSAVSIARTTPSATLVLGTDYTIDLDLGRVYLLPTSATLAAGDDLVVTYTCAAVTYKRIASGSEATISGALRFISRNARGDQKTFYFPKVNLSPSGDYALKGDTWQQMTFEVEILKLDSATSDIYISAR